MLFVLGFDLLYNEVPCQMQMHTTDNKPKSNISTTTDNSPKTSTTPTCTAQTQQPPPTTASCQQHDAVSRETPLEQHAHHRRRRQAVRVVLRRQREARRRLAPREVEPAAGVLRLASTQQQWRWREIASTRGAHNSERRLESHGWPSKESARQSAVYSVTNPRLE